VLDFLFIAWLMQAPTSVQACRSRRWSFVDPVLLLSPNRPFFCASPEGPDNNGEDLDGCQKKKVVVALLFLRPRLDV
jgi:hypothetical protein